MGAGQARTFCGVLVAVSLGLVMPVQAAVVDHSINFGPSAVPFLSAVIGNLPLFDSGLGTLTKVKLEVDANTNGGSIAWDNEANVASTIMLGIGAEVTASAQGGLAAKATPLQLRNSAVDADNDGAADFIGTDSFSVVDGTGSDSGSDMTVAAATLALYTGVGTFPVTLVAPVETFVSTNGGFGPVDPVPGNIDGTVTVTYRFTDHRQSRWNEEGP